MQGLRANGPPPLSPLEIGRQRHIQIIAIFGPAKPPGDTGLNITMARMAWLPADSVGGWLISVGGFAGLGWFRGIVAALGFALALYSRSGKHARFDDMRHASALKRMQAVSVCMPAIPFLLSCF